MAQRLCVRPDRRRGGGGEEAGDGCVLCRLVAATDDEVALVLERAPRTITVMNLYPYGSGHLMVAPIRHVASIETARRRRDARLRAGPGRAPCCAIRATYGPDGINIGANLGRAAGAGVPEPPAHARRAPLDRRHELHDRDRRGPRPPRGPARRLPQTACALARPVASPRAGDEPDDDARRRRAARRSRRHRVRRAVHVPRHQAPPDRRRRSTRCSRRDASRRASRSTTSGFVLAAVLLGLTAIVSLRRGLAVADRPDRSARGRQPDRGVPGRARIRAARVAGTAAAGRRGGSSSTAPTNRPASVDSCSSMR